jgi:glycogen debranching enzyme
MSDLNTTLSKHIHQILPLIQQPAKGWIPHPWLSVSYGEHYSTYLFTWDHHHAALRHAIAGKPQYLRYLADNLTHYQRSDGYTPSMVGADHGPRMLQPVYHAQPFLFQGALAYLKTTGDTLWAQSIYPKLAKYLEFFFSENKAPMGLLRYRVGWYGGIDNDVAHTFFPPDSTISCDLSCLVILECRAALQMAKKLGHKPDAQAWDTRAKALAKAVNNHLWVDEEDSYAPYNLLEGSASLRLAGIGLSGEIGRYAFQTSTNLIPLYAGIAPKERADRMITRYLLNPDHFWSSVGIRSLSAKSEYYNNARWGNPTRFGDHRRMTNSNWQGPVWFPTCYFMCQALWHYGYIKDAHTLAQRITTAMAKGIQATGSMAENYHGDTGKPLYCKKFASWNILADTLSQSITTGQWIGRP